jgi:hypothetical protein
MHPPRFAPAASSTASSTEGPRAANLARRLFGVDLMEWQRFVLDRGLERDDVTGRYRHRKVGVTVPRQNGKSQMLRALIANALITPGAQVAFASQDRQVAVDVLFSPVAEAFEDVEALFGTHVIRSNGHERITLRRLRSSRAIPVSPTEKAGHGYSLDLAIIDEAWAQYDDRLAEAIRPTQIARPDPQLWIVSTAGTAASTFLRGIVDAGRDGELAYFEWSAGDDDDDEDPDTWARANPAYGITITRAALEDARSTPDEREAFPRAHLNRWQASRAGDAIAPALWRACFDATLAVPGERMTFGVEVAQDRSTTVIVAAGLERGRLVVEVVDERPGTKWAIPRLLELRERHRPAAIVANLAGATRSLVDDAPVAGLDLEAQKAGDYVGACQVFYDAVKDERLAHRGQLRLDAAVKGATRRKLAGSWVWGAPTPDVDIAPLVAATLAGARAARPVILPFVATS